MDMVDQAKRAPDLRAVGLALVAGIIVAKGQSANIGYAAGVVVLGFACYYLGTEWE